MAFRRETFPICEFRFISMEKNKLVIIGSTSFLASNLARELILSENLELHLISRASLGFFVNSNAKTHFIDYMEISELQKLIVEIQPKFILNCVAITNLDICESNVEIATKVNGNFVGDVAKIANLLGAKLIHFSTDAVFDGINGGYTEESHVNPFSEYGKSKLLGEKLAEKYSDDFLILRVNFFGWSPNGNRSSLEFFLRNLTEGNKIYGFTDFITSSFYVTFLAQIVLKSMENGLSGYFHIGSEDAISKYEFGKKVAEIFNLDTNLILKTESKSSGLLVSRHRNLSLDSTKIKEVLKLSKLPTQLEGILASKMQLPSILIDWGIEEMDYRNHAN